MGTNYYWHEPVNVCEHCGRGDGDKWHIGKSSAGWCFGLRVHPSEGINGLEDWQKRWAMQDSRITNDDGEEVSSTEMLRTITERKGRSDSFAPDWLIRNHAVQGPNGLARHAYGDVKPGDGTYDLCNYEFS